MTQQIPKAADGKPVFTLAVAMAGAVSAGAYTAGVLDVLFRAVAAHNAAAAAGRHPGHYVRIKAMSGASAGGICAALAPLALADGLRTPPERVTEATGGSTYGYDVGLPLLHDMWVTSVDLAATRRGAGSLLGLGDLTGEALLTSLLDSSVIEAQTERALKAARRRDRAGDGPHADVVADDLDLFLCTSLLRGVRYTVPFADGGAGRAGHEMVMHAFPRHFRIGGLGREAMPSAWLDLWEDHGRPVPLTPGRPPKRIDREPVRQLVRTAIGSGAFPAGLASVILDVDRAEFGWTAQDGPDGPVRAVGRAWPAEIGPEEVNAPELDDIFVGGAATAPMQVVDGGALNNEPFELARYAIRPSDGAGGLLPNPPTEAEATRAVLMIDPFPAGPELRAAEPGDRSIEKALGALPGALMAQARFKPEEVRRATRQAYASRWLISPSRSETLDRAAPGRARMRIGAKGSEALASGLLGGFGGFVSEAQRRHDFMLGQRNARSFLLNHFKLAGNVPVFGGDPAARAVIELQPDILASDTPLPPWPAITSQRLEVIEAELRTRAGEVIDRAVTLAAGNSASMKLLHRALLSVAKRRLVAMAVDGAMGAIREGVVEWEMMDG